MTMEGGGNDGAGSSESGELAGECGQGVPTAVWISRLRENDGEGGEDDGKGSSEDDNDVGGEDGQ